MPRCGVCNGWIRLTVIPHAFRCEDDRKAPSRRHLPELDDLVRQEEEDEANA